MTGSFSIDADKISTLLRDCAAEYIMPRYQKLEQGDISAKTSPSDLVTIADRETEAALDRALSAMFPGCVVIGEEGISAGTACLAALQDRDKMIWVADPVDGTYNFVHGMPQFAVMLACVIGGETRHGWIYDVPANRMLYAEAGGGAWLDGVQQKVAAAKPLAETNGFCGARYFSEAQRPRIKAFAPKVKGLHIFGCAGHEYLNVVAGNYDFAIYNRGRCWDHLPGTLAVQEAGGVVRRLDGQAYKPQDDGVALVAVSNAALLDDLHREILNDLRD